MWGRARSLLTLCCPDAAENKLCLCDALRDVLNLDKEKLFEAIFWFKFWNVWNETTVSGEELKNLIDEKKAELSLISFEVMKKGIQIFLSPAREDMPMVVNEVKEVILPILPALPTVVEAVKSVKQPIIFFKSEEMRSFGAVWSLNLLTRDDVPFYRKEPPDNVVTVKRSEVLKRGLYLAVSADIRLQFPFVGIEETNFYFLSTKKAEAKQRFQELEGSLQEAILKFIGIEFSRHLGDRFLVGETFMVFDEIIRDFSQPRVSKQNVSNSIRVLKEELETTISQFELFLNENK